MKQLSFSLISSRWTLIHAGLFSAKIHLSLIFALSASTRFYISSLRQRYCDQRRNSRVSSLGYGKRDDWMEPAPILIIRDVDTWSNCSGWTAQALCTRVQRLLTDLKYSPMSWIFDRGNARLISMIIDIEVNFVSQVRLVWSPFQLGYRHAPLCSLFAMLTHYIDSWSSPDTIASVF